MFRFRQFLAVVSISLATLCLPALAAPADATGPGNQDKKVKLEDLFPARGLFGPSASQMEFSHDGRYAAWLYRPYDERRHGSDLWLMDTESGEVTRLTAVSVMSAFQESTRRVRDDRRERAEKELKKRRDKEKAEQAKAEQEKKQQEDKDEEIKDEENKSEEDQSEQDKSDQDKQQDKDEEVKDDQDNKDKSDDKAKDDSKGEDKAKSKAADIKRLLGVKHLEDFVDEEDADRSRSPRYAGVSSLTWSPTEDELLFISQNDIYRYRVGSEKPDRLTATRASLQSVQYLPDGSGYTYLLNGGLMRVIFGQDLIEQIDPAVPRGESMIGYRISPDGKRLVFLTGKGEDWTQKATRVSIARYRGRFMEVQEVWRQLPTNPFRDRDISVYLYELGDPATEDGRLTKIFEHRESGPRDVLQVPRWSPDSSRIAFAVFEQATGVVRIKEAGYEDPEQDEEPAEDADPEPAESEDTEQDERVEVGASTHARQHLHDAYDLGFEPSDTGDTETEEEPEPVKVIDAKTVYRFLHDGGPNTPRMIQPAYLPDSRRMVFLTEQSGFRHIHVLDPLYEHLQQITRGRHEVLPFGLSPCHRRLFVTTNAEHSAREHIEVIDLETYEITRLTRGEGIYDDPAVSPKGDIALARFANFGSPRELVMVDPSAEEETTLTESHPEKTLELTAPAPELFTYNNRHGHEIQGYMFKPDDWTPNDQRPLIIYVYGGPLQSNRRQVRDGAYSTPGYFFAWYMAKTHGYVAVTIDPRGTSGYGSVFEKANYQRVGRPQTEDLADGVDYLVKNHGVDRGRIGMHGWSFGGFQTQMAMFLEPEVFHVGIAGAGPTEWENYNAWYTTGTVGGFDDRKPDPAIHSLIPLAKNLEGRLMLVHGMEDSNVLFQDTIAVYSELLKQGKEALVELFLDPTGGHGMGGLVKTVNRYNKYEDYFLRHLGKGEPAQTEDEETEEDTEGQEQDEPDFPGV